MRVERVNLRIRLITSAEVLPLFLCLWNLLKCTKTNAQRSSIFNMDEFQILLPSKLSSFNLGMTVVSNNSSEVAGTVNSTQAAMWPHF